MWYLLLICEIIFVIWFLFRLFYPDYGHCKYPLWRFKTMWYLLDFCLVSWNIFIVKHQILIYIFDVSHVIIPPIILMIHWWYFAAFFLLHTTFPLLSICANQHWAHYLGFCLHLSIPFFPTHPCVIWLWIASSHLDFNPKYFKIIKMFSRCRVIEP